MGYHQASPRKRTARRLAENPQPDEPEWVAQARRLRRVERWSYQRIADHLLETGAIAPQVTPAAAYRRVYKRLNYERVRATDTKARTRHPEAQSRKRREQYNKNAPVCSVCGEKLYRRAKVLPPVCRDCRLRAGALNKAAIAGLSLAGLNPKQISERLGIAAGTVNTTVATLRREGIPIPYKRRPRGQQDGPTHPRQS